MAIRNEIQIGIDARFNGMTMFRKVDNVPFNPQFSFNDDDTLAIGSNITVNYVEYYKNSLGVIISELTKHKFYVVPNVPATYKDVKVIDVAQVLYVNGAIITPAVLYVNGATITPQVLYLAGEEITPATPTSPAVIANGTEVKTPAVISNGTEVRIPAVIAVGTEIKVAEVSHIASVIDKPEWMASSRWFLSVARTPMTAPYGIMDGIEGTLKLLPMGIPNGYVLTGAL